MDSIMTSEVPTLTDIQFQAKGIRPVSQHCLLRLPSVISRVGIARSTIYKLIAEGKFPEPYRISSRLSVWAVEDIDAWVVSIKTSRLIA